MTTPHEPALSELHAAVLAAYRSGTVDPDAFPAFLRSIPGLAFEALRLHSPNDVACFAAAFPLSVPDEVRGELTATVVFDRGRLEFDPHGDDLDTDELADALHELDQEARRLRFALYFRFPAVRAVPVPPDAFVVAVTRADALQDGQLVDTGHLAKVAGFPVPVAITEGAGRTLVADSPNEEWPQSAGLAMLAALGAAREAIEVAGGVELDRRVPCVAEFGGRTVPLVVVVHRGDELEICATIMLPDED